MSIKNIIGILIRDLVVLSSGPYVEYGIYKGKFVYKWKLPFSFSIGKYLFLKEKEYNSIGK